MPDIKGAGEGVADKGKGAFGALGHKIGPLPLWGWAVAGVAVVFVVGRFKGGGGGAGAGSFVIPNTTGAQPIANPQTNAGGASTIDPAASPAPPWWSKPPAWWDATSHAGGLDHPSTNGSGGTGSNKTATDAPKDVAAGGSWFTRLLNPSGNLPAGAAVTTIGGVTYSLSSDALARAGITGASAPPAGAPKQASNTSASGSGGVPFTGQIPGINEKALGPYPYADPTLK